MSDTITPISSEWFHQFYEQTINGQPFSSSSSSFSSDSTIVTTISSCTCASDSLLLSPSSSTSGGQLTPKGVVTKPIRRRSRASKKTPITLLNANTSNFRTLVQQFTGCSKRPTGTQKGPINLNFQLGSVQNQSMETAVMAPYSYNQYYIEQQEQQHHHQHQEQQYTAPFEDVNNFQGAVDISEIDEQLIDDITLHELAKEALHFNENMNDEYF